LDRCPRQDDPLPRGETIQRVDGLISVSILQPMSLIAYQEIDVRTGLEDRNMSSQLVIRDYQDTFDISKLEISHLLDCICSGTQSYSVENILVLLMNNLQEHLI